MRTWSQRIALPLALLAATANGHAQSIAPAATDQTPLTLSQVENVTPLPNGIGATVSGAAMQITALRPDVLRVRVGRNGALPEDASWAVLPAARTASSEVQPDSTPDAV